MIVLIGWVCDCGIFNGEEKEKRTECRTCGKALADQSPESISSLSAAVASFARDMVDKLRENAFKGGWQNDPPHLLLARVYEEAAELTEAFSMEGEDTLLTDKAILLAAHHLRLASNVMRMIGPAAEFKYSTKEVVREAADVANMVMMISDNVKRER